MESELRPRRVDLHAYRLERERVPRGGLVLGSKFPWNPSLLLVAAEALPKRFMEAAAKSGQYGAQLLSGSEQILA